MADAQRLLRYLDSPPRRAELRWKTGGLGHLGGILESDASVGAAAAVQRTAAATGSLSTRPKPNILRKKAAFRGSIWSRDQDDIGPSPTVYIYIPTSSKYCQISVF